MQMRNRQEGNRGQKGSLVESAKNLCFIALTVMMRHSKAQCCVSTTRFSYELHPIGVTSRCGGSHCRITAAWSLHALPAAPPRVLQLPHTVQRCAWRRQTQNWKLWHTPHTFVWTQPKLRLAPPATLSAGRAAKKWILQAAPSASLTL